MKTPFFEIVLCAAVWVISLCGALALDGELDLAQPQICEEEKSRLLKQVASQKRLLRNFDRADRMYEAFREGNEEGSATTARDHKALPMQLAKESTAELRQAQPTHNSITTGSLSRLLSPQGPSGSTASLGEDEEIRLVSLSYQTALQRGGWANDKNAMAAFMFGYKAAKNRTKDVEDALKAEVKTVKADMAAEREKAKEMEEELKLKVQERAAGSIKPADESQAAKNAGELDTKKALDEAKEALAKAKAENKALKDAQDSTSKIRKKLHKVEAAFAKAKAGKKASKDAQKSANADKASCSKWYSVNKDEPENHMAKWLYELQLCKHPHCRNWPNALQSICGIQLGPTIQSYLTGAPRYTHPVQYHPISKFGVQCGLEVQTCGTPSSVRGCKFTTIQAETRCTKCEHPKQPGQPFSGPGYCRSLWTRAACFAELVTAWTSGLWDPSSIGMSRISVNPLIRQIALNYDVNVKKTNRFGGPGIFGKPWKTRTQCMLEIEDTMSSDGSPHGV